MLEEELTTSHINIWYRPFNVILQFSCSFYCQIKLFAVFKYLSTAMTEFVLQCLPLGVVSVNTNCTGTRKATHGHSYTHVCMVRLSACAFVGHSVSEHVRGYHRRAQALSVPSRACLTWIPSNRCILQPSHCLTIDHPFASEQNVVTSYLGYTLMDTHVNSLRNWKMAAHDCVITQMAALVWASH